MPSAVNTGVPYPGGRVNSPGNESQPDCSYFGPNSTSTVSSLINVHEVPLLLQVFNLTGTDTVTLYIATRSSSGAEVSAPLYINGRLVTLSSQNDALLIDLPGYYRLHLSPGSLGSAIVVGQETNMSYGSYGLSSYAGSGQNLTFAETATVHPVVTGNSVAENVKLSAVAGNLLQVYSDGVYYGATPPGQYANQYVSSSTGNDANAGTISSPLQTIQKAISNLPDGTAGNIYLLAGDTFHTYPTATTDVINSLTFIQTYNESQTLSIGSRKVSISPYNDIPINTIAAYNFTNHVFYDPYTTRETNFPIIKFTISNCADVPGLYIPIGFSTGYNGTLSFGAINLVQGAIPVSNPAYSGAMFSGTGFVSVHGGHITLGTSPIVFNSGAAAPPLSILIEQVQIADNAVPSTPPVFCNLSQRTTITTSPPQTAGATYVPTLSYTFIGDNVETYLASAALWANLNIYSTAYRSYRNLITSIPIA